MPTPNVPDFRKLLAQLAHHHDSREVFAAFVKLCACALACQTREAEYLEEVKRWKKEELEIFAHAHGALVWEMEREPFTDLLGPVHMDSLGTRGQQWRGEFHTPQAICELIARMLAGDVDTASSEPITLSEPACGSGAMILAYAAALPRAAIRRLRVVAIDINKTACDMCFINTSLWGIPCTVIHGNTLTVEAWGQWDNIHRIIPFLYRLAPAHDDEETASAPRSDAPPEPQELLAAAAQSQGQPPAPETFRKVCALPAGQAVFDFGVAESAAPYRAERVA